MKLYFLMFGFVFIYIYIVYCVFLLYVFFWGEYIFIGIGKVL